MGVGGGGFFKVFLPCFHHSTRGSGSYLSLAEAVAPTVLKLHCLRKKVDWLVQPQCPFMSG